MIQPTIGRIVYYFQSMKGIPNAQDVGPLAAIITHVWTDRMVNLTVFTANGGTEARTSIVLRQPEDEAGGEYCWCEWMPYQVKKPFGSESGEKAVGQQEIKAE